MSVVIACFAFFIGLACGLALRPLMDRRRRLNLAIAQVRSRQVASLAQPAVPGDLPELAMPRDYYTDRERGSLTEGFGLRGTAGEAQPAGEPDLSAVPMPRDYYERETPDDEGILSEGYGLRRKTPPDAAA